MDPEKKPEQPQLPSEQKAELTAAPHGSKVYVLISEAAKFTVLAAFILYAIGFIVWHSYLAKFGTVPADFLRAEYFSAALCYMALLLTFGLPAAMLYAGVMKWTLNNRAPVQTAFYLIAFGWYAIFSEYTGILLPSNSPPFSDPKKIWVYAIIFGVAFVAVGLHVKAAIARHFKRPTVLWVLKPETILRYSDKINAPAYCMLLLLLIGVISNKQLSKPFAFYTMFLPLTMSIMQGINVVEVFSKAAIPLRAIIILYATALMITNIQLFGTSQFDKIPKAVGGGKPEVAYIQLTPPHIELISALQLPTATLDGTNFVVGPVAVLLRSDKTLVFVNYADFLAITKTNSLITAAKEIRLDLVEGIRYVQ